MVFSACVGQNLLKFDMGAFLGALAERILTRARATYWEGCGTISACVDRILTKSSKWPIRGLWMRIIAFTFLPRLTSIQL